MKLIPNTPVSFTKGIAHFNMGDKPHEWREVDNPVWSPEDATRGTNIRRARVLARLSLRETATMLNISVVELSSLERSRVRFESPADEAQVMKLLDQNRKPELPEPKRKLWTLND